MAVTYIMLVGSLSWVAWNYEDDGVRGMALYLCANTLSYVLLSFYGHLPNLVVTGGFYVLSGLSLLFLQYAVIKFFQLRMHWGLGLAYLAVLAGLMVLYPGDILVQTKISDVCYLVQYLCLFMSFFRHKLNAPSCGANMFLAGIVLAFLITLWWLVQTITIPHKLYDSPDSNHIQLELFFSTYIVTLLITNGFLLMTKERIQLLLRRNIREDALTGLHTGSSIEEDGQRHLDQLRQLALPATLLLFDIDYFKNINQQYDYSTGNRIIGQLGGLLQREIQTSHEIYRIQGGKFAVIVPARNIYQVMDLAENALHQIFQHRFARDSQISVSCGISVAMTTDTWTSWLFRAQHALQKAKAYGRNQIQVDEIDFSHENLPNGIARIGKLRWHPGYNSGDTEIDQQHRKLFDQTNTLLQIWIRNGSKDIIIRYITELLQYTEQHYEYEKQRMLPYKGRFSKRISAHISRHGALLLRAIDLFDRYQRSELSKDALFNFLIFELVSVHVRDDDGEIAGLLAPDNIRQELSYVSE